jgi:deubiquitinating protein VCIP135
MRDHLVSNLDRYQLALQDFISVNEWEDIVAESDAEYRPAHGEAHGLGNIHIFVLANVLRRPIILIDSLEGMKSSGDYSATFLPCLYSPEECKGKKGGEINSPIVIAWSSQGRNHFLPIVSVKSKGPALVPKSLLPDVWGGFDQKLLSEYLSFDESGQCSIGAGKMLSESYIKKLIDAMKDLFYQKHEVSSSLVSDVHEQVLKKRGMVHLELDDVIHLTQSAVSEERLCRCLFCGCLNEQCQPDEVMLKPGGELYEIAKDRFGELKDKMELAFTYHGVDARYNKEFDRLDVVAQEFSCLWCQQDMFRPVNNDGSTRYKDGDRTTTPSNSKAKCVCGFKHFYNGKEYDGFPKVLPLRLDWQGEVKEVSLYWFEGESDPSLNSNAYQLASEVVNKHFPGEFGSERLVQQIVNRILKMTKKTPQVSHHHPEPVSTAETATSSPSSKTLPLPSPSKTIPSSPSSKTKSSSLLSSPSKAVPSKIILVGEKHKSLHKEELTMSSKELAVKARIEQNAPIAQSSQSGRKAKTVVQHPGPDPPKQQSPPSQAERKRKLVHNPEGSQEKRLRVSSSDGRTVQMIFPSSVTFQQLDAAIRQQFDIPTGKIRIRYGFPPKELLFHDTPDVILPLQHGEKLLVEIPEESRPEKSKEKEKTSSMDSETGPSSSVSRKRSLQPDADTVEATKKLNESIMMLVTELISAGQDAWGMVKTLPGYFEEGGMFFEKVRADLPMFTHGLHCTMPGMKDKVFAINMKAKPPRLDLCLGRKHLRIGKAGQEDESQCSDESSEGIGKTFSGAVRRKDAVESRQAFSGIGHSLKQPEKPRVTEEERDLMAQLMQIVDQEMHSLDKQIEDDMEREENLDERIERLEADQEDDSDNSTQDSNHIENLRSERHQLQAQLKLKRNKLKELQTQREQLTQDMGGQQTP